MKPDLQNASRFPVFHIPHDGGRFPTELMTGICIPEKDFLDYHSAMRDQDVQMMVPDCCSSDMRLIFEISRLLCDVERFIGPEEIMEQYGMGFCYEKAYDGRTIKQATDRDRALAKFYYDRHHRALNRICEAHCCILLFDMHSYTDQILPPFARITGLPTPDLCIGTDPKFTPPQLRGIVRNRFAEAGFSTAENYPYSGLYVPEDILAGRSNCDFVGIMLEFNRRAYCSEQGKTDLQRVKIISDIIRQIMRDCHIKP